MAFKLLAAELAQQAAFVEKLNLRGAALEAAIEEYNFRVAAAWERLSEHAKLYNAVVQEANRFRAGVAQRLQEQWESKSERWQESAHGVAAQDMVTEWEEELNESELEAPEPLEPFGLDAADQLCACRKGSE